MRLLFPGTFDPFTVGHADLVERALAVADSVVIGIGVNSIKNPMYSADERLDRISRYYKSDSRVEVAVYEGLTVDFAVKVKADAILRGVRSVSDFGNEGMMADANLKVGGVDTLLMVSRPEHRYISSSLVRELAGLHHSVDDMVIDTFR